MAFSKKKLFAPEEIKLADLAKAISHPARIQILKTLVCNDLCNCGELVESMPLGQSTVSQHLKALRDLGLIRVEARAQRSSYSVNYEAFEEPLEMLWEFLNFMKTKKEQKKSRKTTKAKSQRNERRKL